MNVIFLDVDGVLNILSPSYNTTYYRPDGSVKWMDDHLVQRLNYLIKKTSAKVVISSSWRGDMEDLKEQLIKNGFIHWDQVIGATSYNHRWRGDQIQEYLDSNPSIKNFVVLEDEIEDVCGEKCSAISREKVVEVDMKNGLSDQDITLAQNILGTTERK